MIDPSVSTTSGTTSLSSEHRPTASKEAPTGNSSLRTPIVELLVSWPVRVQILIGTAMLNFALIAPRPVLGAMESSLGGHTGDHLLVKLVVVIVGLGVVVGAPISAVLIRRLGYRLTILGALALFILAGSAPCLLSDLSWIVISRFILGLACAGINVSAVTLIGDLFQEHRRARMIGLMNACGGGSAIVLGPVVGWVGEYGWRAPFLLFLAAVPLTAIATFGLPSRSVPSSRSNATIGIDSVPKRSGFPFGIVAVGFVAGILLTMPPLYLAFRFGDIGITSSTAIGASYLAVNIPEVITSMSLGLIRRHFKVRSVLIFGFALAMVGLGLLSIVSTYIGILIGMVIYGPAVILIYSGVIERASADNERRAQVIGIVTSTMYIALAAGPIVFEVVDRELGAAGVMMAMSIISGMMMLAFTARGYRDLLAKAK